MSQLWIRIFGVAVVLMGVRAFMIASKPRGVPAKEEFIVKEISSRAATQETALIHEREDKNKEK